jgi:hypothetical protein
MSFYSAHHSFWNTSERHLIQSILWGSRCQYLQAVFFHQFKGPEGQFLTLPHTYTHTHTHTHTLTHMHAHTHACTHICGIRLSEVCRAQSLPLGLSQHPYFISKMHFNCEHLQGTAPRRAHSSPAPSAALPKD